MSLRQGLVLVPALLVGFAGFTAALAGRDSDPTFVFREEHPPSSLRATDVEAAVRKAPEPETRQPGSRAKCRPLGKGELRNPWACTVFYGPAGQIDYSVVLSPDGGYTARFTGHPRYGFGSTEGCCVRLPNAP